jgi:hypothetical protein
MPAIMEPVEEDFPIGSIVSLHGHPFFREGNEKKVESSKILTGAAFQAK